SFCSRSTISGGVPLGAIRAVQLEMSTSGTPLSCRVGHSELKLERLEVVTASTRIRPFCRNGLTEEIASTPSGTSPPASEGEAGAPPLQGPGRSLPPPP